MLEQAWIAQLASIGAVLLLLVGLLALLRRRGMLVSAARPGNVPKLLQVTARQSLTAQHLLFLVEADGSRFVVVTTPAGAAMAQVTAAFPALMAQVTAAQTGSQPRERM
jgi:flagellar biogenesis protein FliO